MENVLKLVPGVIASVSALAFAAAVIELLFYCRAIGLRMTTVVGFQDIVTTAIVIVPFVLATTLLPLLFGVLSGMADREADEARNKSQPAVWKFVAATVAVTLAATLSWVFGYSPAKIVMAGGSFLLFVFWLAGNLPNSIKPMFEKMLRPALVMGLFLILVSFDGDRRGRRDLTSPATEVVTIAGKQFQVAVMRWFQSGLLVRAEHEMWLVPHTSAISKITFPVPPPGQPLSCVFWELNCHSK